MSKGLKNRGINRRKSSKKGMTIIETVISLAVIAIVSFTAIGFINRFSDVNAKMIYETDARLTVENALECFKYAEDETQFFNALNLTRSGFVRQGGSYILADYNYTVVIAVSFPPEGAASFTCHATDSSGRVIVSVTSYTKEVAA